jgi:hypothetical protein
MVSRNVSGNIGQRRDPDRSPPFDQGKIVSGSDVSLLREKILAKLEVEDVRAAITAIGTRQK